MAVAISTDFERRTRAAARFVIAAIALIAARPADAADGKTLIDDVWTRYRTVRTERQDSEILVIAKPQAARYTRADVEGLLLDPPSGVVHKRAVHHVRYADDGRDQLHVLFSLPAEDAGLGL